MNACAMGHWLITLYNATKERKYYDGQDGLPDRRLHFHGGVFDGAGGRYEYIKTNGFITTHAGAEGT